MIGEIIRESQIPVWSGEQCSSACVFILVSGVERRAQGAVGLHRPYFDKSYFADLTSTEAKVKYYELKKQSIDYLRKMEVGQQIIERIFATDSTNIDLISEKEANNLFGFRSPFYEEWLMAKCGKYTDEESKIIKSYWSLMAARTTYAMLQDKTIPKTEDFGDNLPELVEDSQLAYQLEKANLLDPYVTLSNTHKKCIENAASQHIYSFHYAIKKYLENSEK